MCNCTHISKSVGSTITNYDSALDMSNTAVDKLRILVQRVLRNGLG